MEEIIIPISVWCKRIREHHRATGSRVYFLVLARYTAERICYRQCNNRFNGFYCAPGYRLIDIVMRSLGIACNRDLIDREATD